MFAESLTIRILADSSSLRSELDAAVRQLDQFQSRVAGLVEAGRNLASAFGSLSQTFGPLQTLSKLLGGIHQQITTISATPLSIDVSPALAALAGLAAAIDTVTARLSAMSAATASFGAAGPGMAPAARSGGAAPLPLGMPVGAPQKFSLVSPAVATAAANRTPSAPTESTTNNHFGGITINVQETADVNALIRDLRLQGAHLRNRRG